MTRATVLLSSLILAACETTANSGPYVEVRIINATGLANVLVRVSGGGSTVGWTFFEAGGEVVLGTSVKNAGEAVSLHAEAGGETADRTCHVSAEAIGSPSNIPRAIIESQPIRVICQSGWQEVASP